jgi:ribosomal protein S18 acetylase RimI-like enzyme
MAKGPSPEVRPLGPKESAGAGEVLGRAFQEDPLWVAVMPDSVRRPARLTRMFTGLTRAVVAAGGIAERTPGFEAVALWLPPGCDLGLWATVRSGFALPRSVLGMPGRDRRLMLAVLRQIDAWGKQLMPAPHWYVPAIGVAPEHQGRGLGSALMRAGIARADRDGRPIYLETETEGNVGYYEHLGFDVIEQMVAAEIDLPFWLMLRRPAPTPR